MSMEFSELVAAPRELSKLCRPIASRDGKFIATVSKATVLPANGAVPQFKLVIRSSRSLMIKKQLQLPPGFIPKIVKWYQSAAVGLSVDESSEQQLDDEVHRIFAANDDGEVRIWDLDSMSDGVTNGIDDLKSVIVIRQVNWGPNVSIKNVEWGRSPDEILVFSDYQVALAVWSLVEKESVEIYHPKYYTAKGFSFQPGTRHLAVLTRPVSEDTISLYGGPLSELETLSTFGLSDFYDAKGFKWSPDGRWIAVYDTITNFQVGIYTPSGGLYRVFAMHDIGLGVHGIEWSTGGNLLAVASYDGVVRCLNTLTFTPTVILRHSASINTKERIVFVEQPVKGKEGRAKYQRAQNYPVSPPKLLSSLTDAPPKTGFSIVKFNKDGTLLATRFDLIPTTLWVWSLRSMTVLAVLVHVRKIKSVEWHPQKSHLLLITCANSQSKDDEVYENYDLADVGNDNDCCVYIWNAEWRNPYALRVPRVGSAFASVTHATWIRLEAEVDDSGDEQTLDDDSKLALRAKALLCDRGSFTVGYLDDDQEPEDDDTKVQRLIDGVQQQEWAELTTTSYIEDTFAMVDQRRTAIKAV
ncbi:WD40-repeat-containing domain protein [Lipomyces tetrasporus]|uniref:WD40-repeat-containing domain protein n=1 Tax=Lipomyces tetrasporus TaxID=54092 RepID=A0AAD7QLZ1_9ASCO|nr:WD40-repeat-containing domain protein [Lipomyces tetrasporus]KAJ8097410.1 WD40-repeat-containing domain protein [Lipomyces tetrasporus]